MTVYKGEIEPFTHHRHEKNMEKKKKNESNTKLKRKKTARCNN